MHMHVCPPSTFASCLWSFNCAVSLLDSSIYEIPRVCNTKPWANTVCKHDRKQRLELQIRLLVVLWYFYFPFLHLPVSHSVLERAWISKQTFQQHHKWFVEHLCANNALRWKHSWKKKLVGNRNRANKWRKLGTNSCERAKFQKNESTKQTKRNSETHWRCTPPEEEGTRQAREKEKATNLKTEK